jgi:hypothetical protein
MRRVAIAVMAAILLVTAVALARLAVRDRTALEYVATPPPIMEATPVELDDGEAACQRDVVLTPSSQVIRVWSGAPTPDVPRLRVTAEARGWSMTALSPEHTDRPGGGGDGIYDTRIDPPPREVLATVCVASAEPGRAAILAGSEEPRIVSRSATRVDGREIDARVGLAVLSGGPQGPLSHARELLERAAAFAPAPVGWLSLGLLLAVVAIGVPAAAVYAVLRALREETGA